MVVYYFISQRITSLNEYTLPYVKQQYYVTPY